MGGLGMLSRLLSVIALDGGSRVHAEAFMNYHGSGYNTKLVDYPISHLRLMKQDLRVMYFLEFKPFSWRNSLILD